MGSGLSLLSRSVTFAVVSRAVAESKRMSARLISSPGFVEGKVLQDKSVHPIAMSGISRRAILSWWMKVVMVLKGKCL